MLYHDDGTFLMKVMLLLLHGEETVISSDAVVVGMVRLLVVLAGTTVVLPVDDYTLHNSLLLLFVCRSYKEANETTNLFNILFFTFCSGLIHAHHDICVVG